MTEETQTVEEDEVLTGSGAPEEAPEDHPEPVPFGFVKQDNVTDPGVQHTQSIDGTTSSHGEPDAADDEDDAPEEAEGDDDPED